MMSKMKYASPQFVLLAGVALIACMAPVALAGRHLSGADNNEITPNHNHQGVGGHAHMGRNGWNDSPDSPCHDLKHKACVETGGICQWDGAEERCNILPVYKRSYSESTKTHDFLATNGLHADLADMSCAEAFTVKDCKKLARRGEDPADLACYWACPDGTSSFGACVDIGALGDIDFDSNDVVHFPSLEGGKFGCEVPPATPYDYTCGCSNPQNYAYRSGPASGSDLGGGQCFDGSSGTVSVNSGQVTCGANSAGDQCVVTGYTYSAHQHFMGDPCCMVTYDPVDDTFVSAVPCSPNYVPSSR